jgi:hypothetical protein
MSRFAPRLATTRTEPFALKDAAAILHPSAPWIAYHLFWDDDIDFPDDNDPCDHEVIWVRLTADRKQVRDYYTYFHGKVVPASPAAVADANANGGRPRIAVQWGKHGSMPVAAGEPVIEEADNRRTYLRLSTKGRDSQESPLGRKWPLKFQGTWQDYVDFAKPVEIRTWLDRSGYVAVSCLNNAVINRRFLTYNFAAKTEWPDTICQDLR